MLMTEDADSMFHDLDSLLGKEGRVAGRRRRLLSADRDFLLSDLAELGAETTGPSDPFLGHKRQSLKLSVDRQASLDDLAHVIRQDAALESHTLSDGADTIQDLAKYLKDDSSSSPTIPNLIASAGFNFPPTSSSSSSNSSSSNNNAPMHNYACRDPPPPTASLVAPTAPIRIKQERPDTPEQEAPPELDHFQLVYQPSYPKRKRISAAVYKEERQSDDGSTTHDQERDADLPPPRKYVRKNPKDLDEYRRRRERNNEAVRRARAKKRQTEAMIHAENRHLRQENQKLQADLEASRLQIATQERVIASLRTQVGQTNTRPEYATTGSLSPRRKSTRRILN